MKYTDPFSIKPVFVIALLLFALRGNAQFSFSPSTTLIKNQALNLMTYDSIHISNTSSDTINLNWQLISYDTVAGTYFDFCSSGNCWLGVPDTGSFPPIEPGGFGWAGAHFWTGNVAVTCSTRIRIYDEKNPTASDTITFILNAVTSGILDEENNNLFYAGPNPTNGIVFITDFTNTSENIEVFNSSGQYLHSVSGNKIDLSSYPNGTYFIAIHSKAGISYKQLLLSK